MWLHRLELISTSLTLQMLLHPKYTLSWLLIWQTTIQNDGTSYHHHHFPIWYTVRKVTNLCSIWISRFSNCQSHFSISQTQAGSRRTTSSHWPCSSSNRQQTDRENNCNWIWFLPLNALLELELVSFVSEAHCMTTWKNDVVEVKNQSPYI